MHRQWFGVRAQVRPQSQNDRRSAGTEQSLARVAPPCASPSEQYLQAVASLEQEAKAWNKANPRRPFDATVVCVAGVRAIRMPYMHRVDIDKSRAAVAAAIEDCAACGVLHADLKRDHVGEFSASKGPRPVGLMDLGRHELFDPKDASKCSEAAAKMRRALFGED